MTGLVMSFGRRITDPLSWCLRLAVIIGVIQGFTVILLHITFGTYTVTGPAVLYFPALLAATSVVLVLGGAGALARYRTSGLIGPVVSVSIAVAGFVLLWVELTGLTRLAGIVAILAGLIVGIIVHLRCCRRRTAGTPPDALTGYFTAVLGALVVGLTALVFAQAVANPVSSQINPIGFLLIAGTIVPFFAAVYGYLRARTEPPGSDGTAVGIVLGVRTSPNGPWDFYAPYVAEPHRVDLVPAASALGSTGGDRLHTYYPSKPLAVASKWALVATVLFTVSVAIFASLLPVTVPCSNFISCAGIAQVAYFVGVIGGAAVASLSGHAAVRYAESGPGLDCTVFEHGAVLRIDGNEAVIPDGTGTTALWFVRDVEKLGVVSPNDPRLERELSWILESVDMGEAL